jgi:hypothetical protein
MRCLQLSRLLTSVYVLARVLIHCRGTGLCKLRSDYARGLPDLRETRQVTVRVLDQADLFHLETLVLIVVGNLFLSLRDIGLTEHFRSRLRRGGLVVAVASNTCQKKDGNGAE